MADIDVLSADIQGGRINSLKIRFKGNLERVLDRDKTLHFLKEGHSLVPVHGHGHHVTRGRALVHVEVDGELFVRSDFELVAEDQVSF